MRLEQEASEELVNKANKRGAAIKGLLSTAAFAIPGGTAMKGLQKILPFLNESLPVELAIKGLSKINPKVKDFVSKASINGYNAKDALDFLREKSQETISQTKGIEKKLEDYRKHAEKDSPALAKLRKEMGGEKRYLESEMGKMAKQREKQILQERTQAEKLEREKIQGAKQGQQQGVGQAALMQILQQINKALG